MSSLRTPGSQPRRVPGVDAVPEASTQPVAVIRPRRLALGSLAAATAGLVGILAFAVPGVAAGASSAEATPTAAATSEARPGSIDTFAAREDSVSRSAGREASDPQDVAAAAEERASDLAEVTEQVSEVQVETAAVTRAQVLADTSARIDAEGERLANQDKFFWPTAGGINSPWGMRLHPILGYKRLHGGADIGGALGAPIYAVLDGTITKAATGYNSGSGNNVRIDHGQVNGEHLETSYLHMSELNVSVGQTVKRGQLIGTVGSTGLSTAPHLHFSLYVNGANSDPAPYLNRGLS